MADGGYNLPSDAQHRFTRLQIQVDFYYRDQNVVVFVDGPHHDTPEQRAKDAEQSEALLDAGCPVVARFHHAADWNSPLLEFPGVFGKGWGPSAGGN